MTTISSRRAKFFLTATFGIWLVVCLPLTILATWLFALPMKPALGISALLALPLAAFMWVAVQSANLIYKWPAVQLLGLTTILISVLLLVAPLHFIVEAKTTGLIALICWLFTSAHAVFSALNIKNTHHTIRSHKLSNKLRIVHLSDLHAGSRSKKLLKKVVKQSLAHQPHAIVITGDLLDSSQVDAEFLSPLAEISCPVWMSLGNHERYVDLAQAINAIEHQQVKILRNTSAEFKELHIIGIDDTDNPDDASRELARLTLPENKFSILLYHRPDGWQAAVDKRVDLMLSGHTHAGQIWPFGLLVKLQFPKMAGYFSHPHNTKPLTSDAVSSHLVVSQGTGTWGPTMRLATRSEIIILDLQPAV